VGEPLSKVVLDLELFARGQEVEGSGHEAQLHLNRLLSKSDSPGLVIGATVI
jgi:hypothetical protein